MLNWEGFVRPLDPIPIEGVRQARENLQGLIIRTPLIPFWNDDPEYRIYLKLEVLQAIGSFKLRGAANRLAGVDAVKRVVTASAGNMGQGVAWVARQRGFPCTVVMPDHAPETKQERVRRLGAEVRLIPFPDWWQTLIDRRVPGLEGLFIHPVSDPEVMAGNGTIALEILEDLPDVDSVIVPYGGGGLSCGIASVFRALKPDTRIFASEVETAAPLAASLKADHPVRVEYQASFVDGIGGSTVLAEMWPLARQLLAGSRVVSLQETADAIRMLLKANHVLAEGAGASSLAAALKGSPRDGKTVCVISGGNIDASKVAQVLQGTLP